VGEEIPAQKSRMKGEGGHGGREFQRKIVEIIGYSRQIIDIHVIWPFIGLICSFV
jgi:hypothetical protein